MKELFIYLFIYLATIFASINYITSNVRMIVNEELKMMWN
jgi:hypothetical protein